jgi:Cu/Ag efflux protein CusF
MCTRVLLRASTIPISLVIWLAILTSSATPVLGGYFYGSMEGRYELKGVIKSVNKPQKSAVIRHEKVGDYMEPMTMPFFIKDENALQQLEPRDQIVATLIVTKNKGEWLENIVIVAKGR